MNGSGESLELPRRYGIILLHGFEKTFAVKRRGRVVADEKLPPLMGNYPATRLLDIGDAQQGFGRHAPQEHDELWVDEGNLGE